MENYSLSDCVNYAYSPMGDCSGRVEKVFGQIVCEHCRNYRQTLNRTQVLRAVQANDPDGWTREPNQKDYDEFRSWVIGTFGEEVWDEYHGNWGISSDI